MNGALVLDGVEQLLLEGVAGVTTAGDDGVELVLVVPHTIL